MTDKIQSLPMSGKQIDVERGLLEAIEETINDYVDKHPMSNATVIGVLTMAAINISVDE